MSYPPATTKYGSSPASAYPSNYPRCHSYPEKTYPHSDSSNPGTYQPNSYSSSQSPHPESTYPPNSDSISQDLSTEYVDNTRIYLLATKNVSLQDRIKGIFSAMFTRLPGISAAIAMSFIPSFVEAVISDEAYLKFFSRNFEVLSPNALPLILNGITCFFSSVVSLYLLDRAASVLDKRAKDIRPYRNWAFGVLVGNAGLIVHQISLLGEGAVNYHVVLNSLIGASIYGMIFRNTLKELRGLEGEMAQNRRNEIFTNAIKQAIECEFLNTDEFKTYSNLPQIQNLIIFDSFKQLSKEEFIKFFGALGGKVKNFMQYLDIQNRALSLEEEYHLKQMLAQKDVPEQARKAVQDLFVKITTLASHLWTTYHSELNHVILNISKKK